MERSVIRERSISLIAAPGFHFVPSGLQTKERKAERRKTQTSILRTSRCGARLARRARLPAFHHGSCLRDSRIPKAQPQAMLPGERDADTGGDFLPPAQAIIVMQDSISDLAATAFAAKFYAAIASGQSPEIRIWARQGCRRSRLYQRIRHADPHHRKGREPIKDSTDLAAFMLLSTLEPNND